MMNRGLLCSAAILLLILSTSPCPAGSLDVGQAGSVPNVNRQVGAVPTPWRRPNRRGACPWMVRAGCWPPIRPTPDGSSDGGSGPRTGAKTTPVPWIIQEVFPGYHGVAWYWRDFVAPANAFQEGVSVTGGDPGAVSSRLYLLRFWGVDYLADVWLNGVHLGRHEGGEFPFVLDATGPSSRRPPTGSPCAS